VPIVLTSGVETATADPPTCALPAPVGDVITLTGDCDTTVPLTIPNGITLNGAGFTITAHDPAGGNFSGAVLTNAGTSMSVENLTIEGTGFATDCTVGRLMGIFFNDASGSVSGVRVEDITQHSGCPLGQGIRANATLGTARTVTITNTVVSGYQKGALVASGMMTMNVSASTFGPPDRAAPALLPSQNGVQYGGVGVNAGSGGTITDSTIYGSGFINASDVGTAVLLFGAHAVTLTGDTVTGTGTDIGVNVTADSTGAVIDRNQIGRMPPDLPTSVGVGVNVDAGSAAAVTCNAFSGWQTDLVGVPPQPVCVTTTTLSNGTVGTAYSAAESAVGGTPPYSWSLVSGSLPPGLALSSTGTISGTPTLEGNFAFTVKATDSVGGTATQALTITITAPARGSAGYWITARDGGVFTFGAAAFHGSAAGSRLAAPVVGIAATATGGYWLAAADGGVFSYGTAFFGSLGGTHLNAPIVGIAATPDDRGYYLVGADGGVFTFGDAQFHGSMAGKALNKPVVGIAVTADNGGYYLAAADGGVFTFGDARFQGSMGATPLNKPVVGIAVDDTTSGYWLVAGDGGLFTFGAPFLGSTANIRLNAPVVGMAATDNDLGYRFVASDGGEFCFGSAPFLGSQAGAPLNQAAVGMASVG
jgi:hypothetical protein